MDLAPHHIGLVVSDLDRSVAFYETLGFAVESSLVPAPGRSLTFMRSGDFRLELFWYQEPPPTLPETPGHPIGFRHFALMTDDLDAVVAELKAMGTVPQDAEIRDVMGTYRLLFLNDPDGIEIELSQEL